MRDLETKITMDCKELIVPSRNTLNTTLTQVIPTVKQELVECRNEEESPSIDYMNKDLLKHTEDQEMKRENTEGEFSLDIKEEDEDLGYKYEMKMEEQEQGILRDVRDTKSHKDVQEFQCNLCHKIFKDSLNLLKHNNEHIKVNTNSLSKSKINKSNYSQSGDKCYDRSNIPFEQINGVHTEIETKCKLCGKEFKNVANLNRHIMVGHKLKKSPKRVIGNGANFYHMKLSHSGLEDVKRKEKDRYTCKACEGVYQTERNLKRHVKRMHYDYGRMFECRCGKKFRTPMHLREHKKQHQRKNQDNKIFQCDSCQKCFKTKHNLIVHMKRVHYDYGRMFTCWCGRQFCSPIRLDQHKRRRHNPKNQTTNNDKVQCDACNKVFNNKQYLTTHIKRMHYDYGKLFECWCGKKFSSPMNLTAHKRLQHVRKFQNINRVRFQCDSCQKFFKAKHSLMIHIKKLHFDYGKSFECWCGKKYRSPIQLQDHKKNQHVLLFGGYKFCL